MNYYFLIESIHAFYSVNNVVYKALLVCKERVVSFVYKIFISICSIYASVSKMTILTFSEVMDQHLQVGAYELSNGEGVSLSGG